MVLIAVFTVVLFLSASIARIGLRLSGNQKKIEIVSVWRLLWGSILIFIALKAGHTIAVLVLPTVKNINFWLAALIFFALGVKTIYNAIKHNSSYQMITPFHIRGFWVLLILILINAFIAGMGLGFLNAPNFLVFINGLFIIFATCLSYFAGFKIKRIPSDRLNIIAGVIYILLAFLIINT